MSRDSEPNRRQRNQNGTPETPEPELNLDMLWPKEEQGSFSVRYRYVKKDHLDIIYPKDDLETYDPEEEYPDDNDYEEEYSDNIDPEEDDWETGYPETEYAEDRYQDRRHRPKGAGKRRELSETGKKKKKKRSRIRSLLAALLLLAAAAAGFWGYTVISMYSRMNYVPAETADGPAEADDVTNILLIGSDTREANDAGRSDAMLLLSVNNRTKKICMTSFLRDMYVEIPGHQNNRLNMAYSYGGAGLLMETLEQNFGIDVNRYVLVDFSAFAHLVDAAGGVDLELTNDEVIYVNGYLAEYNVLENRPAGTDYLDETLSGMIHLNGPQALAYCRNRYIGTDFARTGRQRKVLSALVKKAPVALTVHFGELTRDLPGDLTTNLTGRECMRLGLTAPAAVFYEIEQNHIPVDGSYSDVRIDDMAVLQVDFEENRQFLRESIYGDSYGE